jgi:regulator of replication initiation timing
MSWNIFKRIRDLESNLSYFTNSLTDARIRIQQLETNAPRSLSEAEVKRRLKAAAYSSNYYKNKRAAALVQKDAP